MVGILLYVLAGIVFGYAVRGVLGWVFPLAIVAVFGVGTLLVSTAEEFRPFVFLLALLLTGAGVLIGRFLSDNVGGAETRERRRSA